MGVAQQLGKAHVQFGDKVADYRHKRDLTQEELAEKVGVDRSYMGFIERGERNPTLDKIDKIARALGISIRRLFE